MRCISLHSPLLVSTFRFVHASAYDFVPTHKFDVVAFSDVLYYVNYEKVSRTAIYQFMVHITPLLQ